MPCKPCEVVVEVDRLPDVEHDRLVLGVRRQRALPGVPHGGQPVEAVVGRGEVHPGGGVRLAGRQRHLAGQQQLAAAQRGRGGGVPLDPEHRVAAPRDVDGDDRTLGGGEPGRAEHQHRRGVQAGPADAALAQPEAVGDGVPLRGALALVPAGEVQALGAPLVDRQHHLEPLEEVAAPAGVGQRVPHPQRTPGEALQLGDQRQPGLLVAGRDPQRGAAVVDLRGALDDEAGRPGVAGRAVGAEPVAAQVRAGEQSVGVLAQQRQPGAVRHPGEARGGRAGRAPARSGGRPAGRRRGVELEPEAGLRAGGGPGGTAWGVSRDEAGEWAGSGAWRTSARTGNLSGHSGRSGLGGAVGSALHGAGGQAADEEALQRQEHHDRHDHGEEATGGGQVPALAELPS